MNTKPLQNYTVNKKHSKRVLCKPSYKHIINLQHVIKLLYNFSDKMFNKKTVYFALEFQVSKYFIPHNNFKTFYTLFIF